MVFPLAFASDFPGYPFDPMTGPPYPPGHPFYQEQTQHLIRSGDYAIGGLPVLKNGIYRCNDRGGNSYLNVQEPEGSPGVNSYTFWADYTVVDAGTKAVVRVLSVGADGGGLGLYFTRNGVAFGVTGQTVEHTRSLHGFSGGVISWHVEVEPGGLWYSEVTTAPGGLAHQACGLTWSGGLLVSASLGQFSFGSAPDAVLHCAAAGGATAVRVGPPECPIPPVGATGPRTQALWLPWGE